MLGALTRLVFLDLLGNLVLLLLDLPRWLRRRPRWVELTLKAPLPERPPRSGRLFGRRPSPSIEGLCRALDDLGKDPRLAGVVVRFESLDGGWARLQAVRGALLRFRSGGKRVVAHLSSPGLREVGTVYLDLMRSYAASEVTILRKVRVPHAVPYLFTALKIAAPASVITAFVSEYFGGLQNGLGSRIVSNIALSNNAEAWAYVLGACLLGLAFYVTAVALERVATPGGVGARERDGA